MRKKIVLRWPLCIDPHGQAKKWIRKIAGSTNGQVIRASNENCLSIVQNAAVNGESLLIEQLKDHNHEDSSSFLTLLTLPFGR